MSGHRTAPGQERVRSGKNKHEKQQQNSIIPGRKANDGGTCEGLHPMSPGASQERTGERQRRRLSRDPDGLRHRSAWFGATVFPMLWERRKGPASGQIGIGRRIRGLFFTILYRRGKIFFVYLPTLTGRRKPHFFFDFHPFRSHQPLKTVHRS